MRRKRGACKMISKAIPRVARTNAIRSSEGPMPFYLLRGGVHHACNRAGTKTVQKRKAIDASMD